MTPLAWLLGLFLPACGYPGISGLPVPRLMDMTHITRPDTPNTALAAPAGYSPPPDIVTPVFPITASSLLAKVMLVARAQPRTFQAAEFPRQMQVHYVARSRIFNFPDLVTVQVAPAAAGSSTLVLYSRSVYGRSDLGVNHKRLETWLSALQHSITPTSER
ncbi:MAG TPA: DUF1499 domain-containing protein [Acetobacteraceae bacterium]|nr:DUF1499 domain-containing protein [Acetobacteraceae bacterium]